MDTAVLVVGAGPTGMMLAAELALAGTDVTLVERDDEPSPQSRGAGSTRGQPRCWRCAG